MIGPPASVALRNLSDAGICLAPVYRVSETRSAVSVRARRMSVHPCPQADQGTDVTG